MNLDWAILHWIQSNMQSDFLDSLMPLITSLGNAGLLWIAVSVVLLFIKPYRKAGLLMLIGMLIGVLIANLGLKHLVARPRPCWLDPSFPLLIATPLDYSFPSGHTLASVISATILTKANWKFGIIAIPIAALIAFSRLYLYVHFPSDVLTSVILGLIIGLLVYRIGSKKITFLS